MGCTAGQAGCAPDESPAQEVTLTRAYALSRTEVTQGQFASVMGALPRRAALRALGLDHPAFPAPAGWHEAAAFADALSSAAGLEACYSCTGSGP